MRSQNDISTLAGTAMHSSNQTFAFNKLRQKMLWHRKGGAVSNSASVFEHSKR